MILKIIIDLILDEDYNPDSKDFKPYLTKLKTKKEVDAILVALLPGQIGVFAKQARQLGFNQDLIGVELFEDPNEVKSSGGALLNQWYVNNDDADQNFNSEYKQRFPKASTYASANGYDLAHLVSNARKAGKDKIAEYFRTLKNYRGALGTYSASGDQRFTLPATIKIVKESGFEKLKK